MKKADQTTKDEVEELMNGGRIKQRMIQELTYPYCGDETICN